MEHLSHQLDVSNEKIKEKEIRSNNIIAELNSKVSYNLDSYLSNFD